MTPTQLHPARRVNTATRNGAYLIVIVALAALPWLLGPYPTTVASSALVATTLALSSHLLYGLAGLPSLGQAAYFGVGAYTAALCASTTTDAVAQVAAAATAATVIAAAVGAALIHARGGVFLVATLAVGVLAATIAEHLPITGAGNGMTIPPATLPLAGALATDNAQYVYTLAATAALIGTVALFQASPYGLALRGIAQHETRMRANGYPTHRYLWTAYILAAGVAGIAGALLAANRHFIAPTDMTIEVSTLALLPAIIGRRSLARTCVAATAITVTRDVAGQLAPRLGPIILGLLMVTLAVAGSRGRTPFRSSAAPRDARGHA